MSSLVALLETKNRCLARFLEVSERFAAEAAAGDWDGISRFNRERESILRALDLFDRKVDEAIAALRDEDKTEDLLARVRGLVEEKDGLIGRIFKVDAVIIERIEDEKSRVGESIGASKRGRNIIGKFKSGMAGTPGQSFESEI